MIEVTVKLVKSPVYLAGETVECVITFSNPQVPLHKRSQSNSDALESLAWASAQIHCQCSTNSKVIVPGHSLPVEQLSFANTETSFAPCRGERGRIVFSTRPRILFCDLRISTGESKSYLYTEVLPSEAPPSYRGQAVKYSYKITIGMQRVNCPIKLLQVPLRVLVINAMVWPARSPDLNPIEHAWDTLGRSARCRSTDTLTQLRAVLQAEWDLTTRERLRLHPDGITALTAARGLPESSTCGDSEDLTPSNPFLETQQRETPLDMGVQLMQNVTARRSPYFYNITNNRGRVVRFCLFKQKYKLGEDIIGTFDFTEATVKCVQFSVVLQSEEEIASGCQRWGSQSAAVVSYSRHHEMCFSMKQSEVILPIPMFISPGFQTELVTLRWRLHFEFVTTLTASACSFDEERNVWQAPGTLDIETMVWNLPINIYPTTPVHIAHVLRPQIKFGLVI